MREPSGPPAALADLPGRYVGTELDLFQHVVRWKSYFARQIRPFLQGDVLEVGAGFGGTTAALHVPGVARWLCLEPDVELCRTLEQRRAAGLLPATVEWRQGTLDVLDPGEHFDAVLYIDVLEHIADDRRELSLAAARIRPGGRLIVLAPAHSWLFSPFDAAIGHHRRYDRRSLRAVAPPDLRQERLRYLDSVGVLASLANRLWMKRGMPSAGQLKVWDRFLVPCSTLLDPLVCYRLGKSLLGVWQRPSGEAHAPLSAPRAPLSAPRVLPSAPDAPPRDPG